MESLDPLQLIGNVVVRGDTSVVYSKSRETICDFLSIVEADNALRSLNNENRVLNCMAGNADRAALASLSQFQAFRKLQEAGGFSALTPALRAVAEARLAHPELSLQELAAVLGVSKSCLNHRIRKLMSLCPGDQAGE